MAPLLKKGNHLVSLVRMNAVAYMPADVPSGKRKKGRPPLYGEKVKLRTLLDNPNAMQVAQSPVYGETNVLAYHRFIQVGLIAQGLLQYLSISFPDLVWAKFGSWLRTIRPGIPPSEYVTSLALRNSFPDFLSGLPSEAAFAKFLIDRIDFRKNNPFRLAA